MNFLITGGSGYLGSHLTEELISNGNRVVVFDNFSGSLVTKNFNGSSIIEGSITDKFDFEKVSKFGPYDGIFHLAAKKSVSESLHFPDRYIETNILGSENILKFAHRNNVKNIVFTSSAAVYGGPDVDVISESQALRPLNPYGETKVAAESLFERASQQESISAVSLRTFNMGGANNNNYFDKRGENVIPKILNSVFGGTSFKIFGNTYPTYDGTCVRDYIHVSDVAKAHIAAMEYLSANSLGTYSVLNVSSNKGTSVVELFQKINEISGRKASFQFADTRPGDPAYSVGSNEAAIKLLKWKPTKSLNQILIESIRAYA